MKTFLYLLAAFSFQLSAFSAASPDMPPTRIAAGSGVTVTTNGINNFTIASSSSPTNNALLNGTNTFTGTNTFSTQLKIGTTAASSATLFFENNSASANIKNTGASLTFNFSGGNRGFFGVPSGGVSSFQLYMDDHVGWTTATAGAGASDVSIARAASGVLQLTRGTVATYGDLKLRTLLAYAQPSDPASSATFGQVYAKTNGATTEVYVMDGAGNVTQISPHARASSPAPASVDAGDKTPIVIHHKNLFTGEQEWLHLSAMARKLEQLTGEKFVWKSRLPAAEVRDWDAEQARLEAESDDDVKADHKRLRDWEQSTSPDKGPAPAVREKYRRAPKPDFLNN